MIRRYSPFVMLFDLGKLARNSLIFVFYLYVLKTGSAAFNTYGRVIFLIVVGLTFFSIIYKWFTHKYKLDHQAFYLYKGLFNKSERTIPFSKIQNIHRHTSLIHRIFHLTSVRFETAMTDENSNIKFEVISQTEAKRIEAHLKSVDQEIEEQDHEFDDSEVDVEHPKLNRTIHFQATKKDILKASFSSLSFLVLIPLVGSFYYKINDVFHVEGTAQGFFEKLISSWWIMTIIVIVLVIASATFGGVRTYLKYGKYEISSDSNLIFITRGVIDETAFSISKEKVQAIEITQSLMKRLLGLAEVKLTSAGTLRSEEDTLEVNTLYPFLPVNKAYKMVSEILPSYAITQKMNRLPKKSLWVRLLRPSWLWIITTGVLYYFKPTILDVKQAWMILSVILLICIVVSRWLNFLHTRYVINDQFIQFKEGALTTSLFLSKREKVIEVKVTRNLIQKMLGLASIGTINRGRPVHHSGINDVPVALATTLFKWYMKRNNEIRVEHF